MLASTPSPLTDLAASRKSKKGGTGRGDGPGDSRGRRAPWPSPWQRRCRHRSRPTPCPPLSLASLRSPSTAAIPGEDPHGRFAPRSSRTRPRRPCQCTHPPSKRSPGRPVSCSRTARRHAIELAPAPRTLQPPPTASYRAWTPTPAPCPRRARAPSSSL